MALPTTQQQRQWDEHGYLVLENALDGPQLARLQQAFDYWTAAAKQDWLERVGAGEEAPTFYDLPAPLNKDDAFLDLVDHPGYDKLTTVISSLLPELSEGEYADIMGGTAQRFLRFPPWPAE